MRNPKHGPLMGLACLVLALVALLLVASRPADAQFEARARWVFDGGDRWLQQTEPGQWAEFVNGVPARNFNEVGRTARFVELYTETPTATWVRVYPRRLAWKTPFDPAWRVGRTGVWAPLTPVFPLLPF